VRLPVRFSSHQGPAPSYTIDPAFLDRVEHLVDVARRNGLRIIVDNHNFDELMADPAGRTAQLTAIWSQVAERLKGKDSEVWFELMNEPNSNLTNTNLVATFTPSLTEIRKNNPTRIVVIGGESWSSVYNLTTVPVFNDARIVYTFHYYEPFNFTHQGAPWINPVLPTGVTFGSNADKAELTANVVRAQDFMTRTGRPLFLGEYGAWEGISLPERAAYYKAVHDAFTSAQIDGCVWAYVNTFPFRDATTGVWYDSLLSAIGL
jgi:endoglucanase